MKCVKNFCEKEAKFVIHHRTTNNNEATAYCEDHIPQIFTIGEAMQIGFVIEGKEEAGKPMFLEEGKG